MHGITRAGLQAEVGKIFVAGKTGIYMVARYAGCDLTGHDACHERCQSSPKDSLARQKPGHVKIRRGSVGNQPE